MDSDDMKMHPLDIAGFICAMGFLLSLVALAWFMNQSNPIGHEEWEYRNSVKDMVLTPILALGIFGILVMLVPKRWL